MRSTSLFFAAAALMYAQAGRFEESKRLGFALLAEGKYDRAAAKLAEVFEVDSTDAAVAEGLAIAYMNGEERKDDPALDGKAREILEKRLAAGGRAVFLVQLNLSNTLLFGSSATNVCSGKLFLSKGRLQFVCERGDKPAGNSFDLEGAQIKEMSGRFDKGRGMFFIKSAKRTYNFYPASWDKKHSQAILALAQTYLN